MPRRALNQLLSSTPQLWRGRRSNQAQRNLPTGYAPLDERLPGRGWPVGAVTELISRKPGLGELSLLFPALANMGEQGQWLILVDPPWIPYPASLHGRGLPLERLLLIRTQHEKESLWACEQALRANRGGALLAWPSRISFPRLRRLQLAAGEHGKLAFLFRPEQAAQSSSPAALRLQLNADPERGTLVSVLKCRGTRPTEPIRIKPPYAGQHDPGVVLPGWQANGSRAPNGRETGSPLQDWPLPEGSAAIN